MQFTRQEPKRSEAGRIGKVSQMLIDKHREEAGGQDYIEHSVKYSSRYAKSAKKNCKSLCVFSLISLSFLCRLFFDKIILPCRYLLKINNL